MSFEPTYSIWKNKEIALKFLKGMRGAIPFAHDQIETMIKIISTRFEAIDNFLDLGCGDGILGAALQERFPKARGVFFDISSVMMDALRKNVGEENERVVHVSGDFGVRGFGEKLSSYAPFDVVVSGFSIHHQTDKKKKEVYEEIYSLLKPGGFFINVEHVLSASSFIAQVHEEAFIDALYSYSLSLDEGKTRKRVAEEYRKRMDKSANILAPLELQLNFLREIGYTDVDCFFKYFELAVFGGGKEGDVL